MRYYPTQKPEELPMTTITQVAQAMQTVLTVVAEKAARVTGFVQRESKLTGATFCQTLVFGWLANPQATLEELAQTAAIVGVEISPQGLDQRFTRAAAACLKQVLDVAVETVVTADAVAVPILQRFNGVYIQDGSTLVLPDALAEVWQGCGGNPGQSAAALKLQVRLDMVAGRLSGPYLQDGRAHDRSAALQTAPLPAGSLRLADLGYWSLEALRAMDVADVFWLSRLQAQTAVFDASGRRWDVVRLLEAQASPTVDIPVELGVNQRLPARLLAVRAPQEVADLRRMRMKDEARRRGKMVTAAQLKLADWNIFVTNVPADRLTLREALVVARVRWQIELIFKLWKSHSRIDEWRSAKPWRILCEVYAKLIAVVIQHWMFLVGCWAYPNRSLFKAAQTVQKHAWHLASAFDCEARLTQALATLQRCLATGCRINKRRTIPHTYQLLLALTDGGLA
jgi:hypothetical protein